jgi:hypothetical protein
LGDKNVDMNLLKHMDFMETFQIWGLFGGALIVNLLTDFHLILKILMTAAVFGYTIHKWYVSYRRFKREEKNANK